MGRLDGKVGLVIGASSGIGYACSRELALAGAKLVVCARSRHLLDKLVTEIEESGGEAHAVVCDCTNEAQQKAAVEATLKYYGKIDIAFNNAGSTHEQPKPLWEHSLEEFENIMKVNCLGIFLGLKYQIPAMQKNGGSIINTTSLFGERVMTQATGVVAYTTSKWAAKGLTYHAAMETAKQNIRINALAPGALENGTGKVEPNDRRRAWAASINLNGRCQTVDDVTQVVVFLASDDARFITGSTIRVDGGGFLNSGPLIGSRL